MDRRPDLTFEKVKWRFVEMQSDPTTTVPELAQHLKLVSFASDVRPYTKILWLIEVADGCDDNHNGVASVAVSIIAKMVMHALDYNIFNTTEGVESALRAIQFFSASAACAKMDDEYKKNAVRFLNSWWKAIALNNDKGRTFEDEILFFIQHREWLRALVGAFINLSCWEYFNKTGLLFATPRLYANAQKAFSHRLDRELTLPDRLSWPHWEELPVLCEEWNARVYCNKSKAELATLVNKDPEKLGSDEAAIESLCGQLFADCSDTTDISILINLLKIFQNLRRKLLK